MTDGTVQTAKTMLEAMQASLQQAARYNPNDTVKPVAILWTDQDSQWQPVLPYLRRLMPEVLTYGNYDVTSLQGPTIWLRCAIEKLLPEIIFPEDKVPVIYFPGIGRQSLRSGEECPDDLKPLVELQYRGISWTQKNGKDWTIEAFLMSEDGGLGLDVARDATTRRSLHTALTELATTPLIQLQGKRLEAEDFDKLFMDDIVKDLLTWLNEPVAVKDRWSSGKWQAFQSRCRKDYKFNPEKDGELIGAERLGNHEGNWVAVWDRFAESPALYPDIPELLRKAAPSNEDMFADASSWPQRNESMETHLRMELLKLGNVSADKARENIKKFEDTHGERRNWVWSQLGKAPLAIALNHLNKLAVNTEVSLGGESLEAIANIYINSGYQADLAMIDALASVKTSADKEVVSIAIHSLYFPWLESTTEHFQKVFEQDPPERPNPVSVKDEGIILFADGLRFDVSTRLIEKMRSRHWDVALGKRWAAMPTVTATAKPAISPVIELLEGNSLRDDFSPDVKDTDHSLNTDRFRKLLDKQGYQYIPIDETGDSSGKGWTEYGDLDKLGHSLQSKLASRIDEQLDLLIERIQALLDAGWEEIRVVTDHGWLLLPGGLPKADLPKYLTQSKWARCATIKGASKVDVPLMPWFWNSSEHVAVPPGIHCFSEGNEYAHGGLSLQECLTPDIRVVAGKDKIKPTLSISEVKWLGMRCQVSVEPAQAGLKVDIRTRLNDLDASITQAKILTDDGIARLLIGDDSLEGTSVVVVLIDSAGHVVNKQSTIVGGE